MHFKENINKGIDMAEYKFETYVTAPGCSVLKRITGNCNGEEIFIPEKDGNGVIVKKIGAKALQCASMSAVIIPESVTSIGNQAFFGCGNLKSVKILGNVTHIGDAAFGKCSSLEEITIPNTVEFIGANAFFECNNLKKIHISSIGKWCEIDFSNMEANPLYYGNAGLYWGDNLLDKISTVEKVRSVKKYAFVGYKKLVEMDIPDGCEEIGSNAFWACESLRKVSFPLSLRIIGGGAFSACLSLVSAAVPAGVTNIGRSAFACCENLSGTGLTRYSLCKSIGEEAYYGCKSLKEITVPRNVKKIGNGAFYGCTSVSTVNYFGDDLDDLQPRNSVFYNLGKFVRGGTNVVIGYSVKKIPGNLFNPCNNADYSPFIENVKFESGSVCREVGENAFLYVGGLKYVIIPKMLTSIHKRAFREDTMIFYRWDRYCWVDNTPVNLVDPKSDPYIPDTMVYIYSETKPKCRGRFWHIEEGEDGMRRIDIWP